MNSERPLVYIAGTSFNSSVSGMFLDAGWAGTRDIQLADLVCFTGGSDINPDIYHEKPIPEMGTVDHRRDLVETREFNAAKQAGIPMVGICRGAQLLNCLNGGRLWQHIGTKHYRDHDCQDLRTNEVWSITSTHHQMMRPTQQAIIVAAACKAKGDLSSIADLKKADGLSVIPGASKEYNLDPEVVWYPDTMSLCFQGHPEYMSKTDSYERFWAYVEEFIMEPEEEKKTA